jgi:hypothetical protein
MRPSEDLAILVPHRNLALPVVADSPESQVAKMDQADRPRFVSELVDAVQT